MFLCSLGGGIHHQHRVPWRGICRWEQPPATLRTLFKKNKQQHRDIWETWHEVYKSKLNSPNKIATSNPDAVNTTQTYDIRWTQLRWTGALLSMDIKLVSCSLFCWRGCGSVSYEEKLLFLFIFISITSPQT